MFWIEDMGVQGATLNGRCDFKNWNGEYTKNTFYNSL